MVNLDNMALQAQAKRDDFLRAAEQQRLAKIARKGTRRFWLLNWRLPMIRFTPFTSKPEPRREERRTRLPGSI
jgi:hypothetical protein